MSEKISQPRIYDIVKVGKNGDTYHRPDGKFLSAHEKAMIEAHSDTIRSNIPNRDAGIDSNESNRIKLSVEEQQRFYDMRHAFADLAHSAHEAKEAGDYDAAMGMMFQLEQEMPRVATEFNMSDQQIEDTKEYYRSIADLDNDETKLVGAMENDGIDVGSVVRYEGKDWAVAAQKRNKRTGEMEYLISDATTKTDGLSEQRFVRAIDLRANTLDTVNGFTPEAEDSTDDIGDTSQEEFPEELSYMDLAQMAREAKIGGDDERYRKIMQEVARSLQVNGARDGRSKEWRRNKWNEVQTVISGASVEENNQRAHEGESLEEYEVRQGVPESVRSNVADLEQLPMDEIDAIARGDDLQATLPGLEEINTADLDSIAEGDDSGSDNMEHDPQGWFARTRNLFRKAKENLWDIPGAWMGGVLARIGAEPNRRDGETDDEYNERKEKRGKVVVGLGYAAVIGTAALAVYKVYNGFESGDANSATHTVGIGTPDVPGGESGVDNDTILVDPTPDLDGVSEESNSEHRNGTGGIDENKGDNDSKKTVEAMVENFSMEARTMERGEGGFKTLQEMGVDSSDHVKVWEEVGKELSNTGQGDLVYRMDDGRWGWSHPGTLDQKALETIAEVIARN